MAAGVKEMITPTLAVRDIEAILFDMNGTLRYRIPDETWQRQSAVQLLTMLGKPDAPASFIDELTRRYKSYTAWANEREVGLSETEIWTKWMTPELPRERIEPRATELMLIWRNRNGRAVLKPDAIKTITELSQRGYRLGVISNTTSTADLPRFIAECGLEEYFQVVILSSVSGYRKPSPEIFWQATRAMGIIPAQCAYLGNKISSDVVGSRKAGLGMAMIVESLDKPREDERSQAAQPDAVIHTLSELLEIFPPRA
jgi:putative hydrolase of the HAD superfamily